jgi:mannose/fructose/N-acetylgalactosamine-specific phosphotransferase system component IIB
LVVADVETLIPVGGANVVGRDYKAVTDSLGHITVPDSCRTLAFSHVNYESRIINLEEVRDTVFLISKLLNVKEVVVFGKGKHKDELKDLNSRLRLSKEELEMLNVNPNSGVNVLALINMLIPKKWKEKWRKNTKEGRRERLKQILRDY